jgi:hypothetical protein
MHQNLLKYENNQCICIPVENQYYPNICWESPHNDILISINNIYGNISACVVKKILIGQNAGKMTTYILAHALSMEDYDGETQETLDRFTEYMIQEINAGRYIGALEGYPF